MLDMESHGERILISMQNACIGKGQTEIVIFKAIPPIA